MSDKDAARAMHWLLNAGFVVAAVGCLVFQSTVASVVGAFLMAIPIVWISWKDGL